MRLVSDLRIARKNPLLERIDEEENHHPRIFALCDCAFGLCHLKRFDKGSTDGVVAALLKKYTLTETTYDKSQITHQGAVLSMKQPGVYSAPAKGFLVYNSTVQDGKVSVGGLAKLSCSKASCHVLQPGEKVSVTKIESKNDSNSDQIKFSIVSVEDIGGGDSAERYGGVITFKFKKGYLAEASPEDVEQAIEAVIAPDDGSSSDAKQDTASSQPAPAQPAAPVTRAAAPPTPPPPAAPAAPAGPPPSLTIGETSSQVLQAYGMPSKIIDLGKKKTYIYKDVKIVFTDDKISDMQPQ
jgi:hypothetical protein